MLQIITYLNDNKYFLGISNMFSYKGYNGVFLYSESAPVSLYNFLIIWVLDNIVVILVYIVASYKWLYSNVKATY